MQTAWTLSSFLVALVAVIFGAAGVGFVLQRVFFPNLKIESPVETLVRHERNKLRRSAGVLVGLLSAMVFYPLGCILNINLNIFGLSDKVLTFWLILAPSLLVPLYLSKRIKD